MLIKLLKTVAGPAFTANAGTVHAVDDDFGNALCDANAAEPAGPATPTPAVESGGGGGGGSDDNPAGPVDYSELKGTELRDLIESRGLTVPGGSIKSNEWKAIAVTLLEDYDKLEAAKLEGA